MMPFEAILLYSFFDKYLIEDALFEGAMESN